LAKNTTFQDINFVTRNFVEAGFKPDIRPLYLGLLFVNKNNKERLKSIEANKSLDP
jgi:hypothetical protein